MIFPNENNNLAVQIKDMIRLEHLRISNDVASFSGSNLALNQKRIIIVNNVVPTDNIIGGIGPTLGVDE